MGRATITGGGTDGLYQVSYDLGVERLQPLIDALASQLEQLEKDRDDKQAEIDAAEGVDAEERAALEIAIQDATAAYRLAVEEKCTPENYQIGPLKAEFDAYWDARFAVQDKSAELYNLNRELSELADLRVKAQLNIDTATELLALAQDTLSYVSGLYTRTWDQLADCAARDGTENACSKNVIATLQSYLMSLMLSLLYYNDLVEYYQLRISRYTYDLERAEAEIPLLEEQIAGASDELKELIIILNKAQTTYRLIVYEYRNVTEMCSPKMFTKEQKAVDDAIMALKRYESDLEKLKSELAIIRANLQNVGLQILRYQELQGLLTDGKSIEAWCVDYTEDGFGDVAMLEIPGEPQNIVLAPDCRAPDDTEGQLVSRWALSASQSFWTAAVLPGWQKYMPTYRVGVLIDKDDDMNMGQVQLDEARSTAKGLRVFSPTTGKGWDRPEGDPLGLPINQDDLGWIEFKYMECDSKAFIVGDRVVVQFRDQDWENPLIIGFESNPRPCQVGPIYYGIHLQNNSGEGGIALFRWYMMYNNIESIGVVLKDWKYWFHWANVVSYSSTLCSDCWREGTVSFSPDFIDIHSTIDALSIRKRTDRENITYTVENQYSALTIKQLENGTECPDGYSSCPLYSQTEQTYEEEYTISKLSIIPLSDPNCAGIVKLLGIPATNSFDLAPERGGGRTPLIGLYGGSTLQAVYASKNRAPES